MGQLCFVCSLVCSVLVIFVAFCCWCWNTNPYQWLDYCSRYVYLFCKRLRFIYNLSI